MTPKKMKKLKDKWREIINNPPMGKTLPKGFSDFPFIPHLNLADKFIGNDAVTKEKLLRKLKERRWEILDTDNRSNEPFRSEAEQILAAVVRIEGK